MNPILVKHLKTNFIKILVFNKVITWQQIFDFLF